MKIAQLVLTKKGHGTIIMDLRKLTTMTDFFVVCSADSDVQVKAIADCIIDGMEKQGVRAWHNEGISNRMWILLDYVDVVVHIFQKEARKFYNLERLWGDAKVETVSDEVSKPVVKQTEKYHSAEKKKGTHKSVTAKKTPVRKKN